MIKQLNINIDAYIDEQAQIQKIVKQLNKLNKVNITFTITEEELEELLTYYIKHNLNIDLIDYEAYITVQSKLMQLDIQAAYTKQEEEYVLKELKKHFGINLSKISQVEDILRVMLFDVCDFEYVLNKYNNQTYEILLTFDSNNLEENWLFSYYQRLSHI